MSAFYFGCISVPGHYLHDERLHSLAYDSPKKLFPWGFNIDGPLFLPKAPSFDGDACVTHWAEWDKEWTILGFNDRSVDKRPGSVSVFVFDGRVDDPLELARATFPRIFKRYDFNVVASVRRERKS